MYFAAEMLDVMVSTVISIVVSVITFAASWVFLAAQRIKVLEVRMVNREEFAMEVKHRFETIENRCVNHEAILGKLDYEQEHFEDALKELKIGQSEIMRDIRMILQNVAKFNGGGSGKSVS